MEKTNKQIICEYFDIPKFTEAERMATEGNSITTTCKLCKKEVKEAWKNKENEVLGYTGMRRHLRNSHKDEWRNEIEPQFPERKAQKRHGVPSNSNAEGDVNANEVKARMGACFRCGVAYTLGILYQHRW